MNLEKLKAANRKYEIGDPLHDQELDLLIEAYSVTVSVGTALGDKWHLATWTARLDWNSLDSMKRARKQGRKDSWYSGR